MSLTVLLIWEGQVWKTQPYTKLLALWLGRLQNKKP